MKGGANMSSFTKKAIKDSFFKLLLEKPIDRITIKDIANDCGISRNTFYYHYEDMPSLVEDMIMDEVNTLIEKYPTIDSFDKGVEVAVEFVLSNRRAAMHVYNSDHRYIYERCLMRICGHVARTFVNSSIPEGRVSDEDRELLVNYYKCIGFGFIIDWCDNGMKAGYARTFKKIIELRKGIVAKLLDIEELEGI